LDSVPGFQISGRPLDLCWDCIAAKRSSCKVNATQPQRKCVAQLSSTGRIIRRVSPVTPRQFGQAQGLRTSRCLRISGPSEIFVIADNAYLPNESDEVRSLTSHDGRLISRCRMNGGDVTAENLFSCQNLWRGGLTNSPLLCGGCKFRELGQLHAISTSALFVVTV
jgi:hypothetical protein